MRQNKVAPKLTQKMINENPTISGFFKVSGCFHINLSIRVDDGEYVWLKNGMIHNENGPANIRADLKHIRYYKNNRLQSVIGLDLAGEIKEDGSYMPHLDSETLAELNYNSSGRAHNVSGPALITNDPTNNEKTFHYYIHGVKYLKNDWEKQPEVIEYQKKLKIRLDKLRLKQKMRRVFGENNGK